MVLVILAILAAILVPALLGWIDKAKEKQYVLDARSAYLAAQTLASEGYGKVPASLDGVTVEAIKKLADVDGTLEWHYKGASGRDAYEVVPDNYTAADGKKIERI